MTVIMSLFLGMVQGITEFIPVSSSGHLAILQNLFRVDYGDGAHLLFEVRSTRRRAELPYGNGNAALW